VSRPGTVAGLGVGLIFPLHKKGIVKKMQEKPQMGLEK